nr:hypothetical protein [Tanacetum cinerariifolium]
MNLLNGECIHCVYGDGKPITCDVCEGMLRGGFCFPCNLKAENSFICDQNAYSFNNNSNYLPQPQYENYLCNLCGNNSHDGYDCQQQFPFVYEQEPSYNQNYNDNYYPYDLPSFPCCDNCGESHETFQYQPMAQNIDFSGSDQIQTPQYPDDHLLSQEMNEEFFQAEGELMKSNQTFLKTFICIPFEENPQILFQAWEIFFAIQYSKPENLNELFQKLLEDLKELAEYENSQRAESQNVVELSAERGNRSIESLQNFRVVHKSSISLNTTSQISLIHAVTTVLPNEEPEYSPSMGYEHPNATSKMESDEIIKSGVEELVLILSENEVTLEDKRECDMPVCKDSSVFDVCDNHSEIFFDSNNDDDISSNDDDFEDIEYVEASLFDPEIVSVEEENVVQQEEEDDLEDISQIQDIDLREKLLSIIRLISNTKSLNDNPTPNYVLNSSVSIPIFKESDNSLLDNFSPEFKTFWDHTEETRSGNTTTHANDSLLEYDSFCFEIETDQERLVNFLKNDISDPLLEEADLYLASDNSIPPVPLPPPKPPDEEFDFRDEILVVIDKLEGIDAKVKFKNDNYFSFIFAKVFSLLFAESEDTIFHPGISG